MDEPIQITASAPPYKSQDYKFLREEGMKIIRQSAADSWTDHNIHDPGITLLEAFAYVVTDVGLRTGMDMADLLTSGEQFGAQEFFTAAEVLPVAPVSIIDFQKVLLDHPLVRIGWVSTLPNDPDGQLSVLLEFADETLNTNIFTLTVTPLALGADYLVDVAFPFWDETEVSALQEDVQILSATFNTPWQPLTSDNAQYANITLQVQPATGPALNLDLWVILQVTSLLNNAVVELPPILLEAQNLLQTLPNQNVFKDYNNQVITANATMRSVQRYIRDYRNLCEDFTEFKAVRLQEVAFSVILEIAAGVDIESLIANILFAIDQYVSPPIFLKSLAELQAEGDDTAEIFEGPMPDSGFVKTSALVAAQPVSKLFTSDILRIIFQQRNPEHTDIQSRESQTNRRIIAIKSLTLSNWLDNHAITKGARDCLQLIDTTRHVPRLSPSKCQVVIVRNDVKITYDFSRAIEIFKELKKTFLSTLEPGSQDISIPKGNILPLANYYPMQNDLPVVYGVGKYGLAENASAERKAKAKQLKGYLFFYEQLLAGQLAQLSHINSLFSADPALNNTVFHQPLYHLPEVSPLFGFDENAIAWQSFQSDSNNDYEQILRSAESRETFLNRRNRFLDHLLARQGEDMQEFADMAYQQALKITGSTTMDLATLLSLQQQRRLNASQQLIRDKSAFYYDLPLLNHDRLQAIGNLLWRLDTAINVIQTTAGYSWQISDYDQVPILESAASFATLNDVERAAATALVLSTAAINYDASLSGGGQFINLREGATGEILAQSLQTFSTVPAAQAAADSVRESLLLKWLEFSLIPLERRLYHFLGIQIRQRRQLITPVTDYFEIYDDLDVAPAIAKRFRLWELPANTGNILLESVDNYPGADDATATASAVNAIESAISNGIFNYNFLVEEISANVFGIALRVEDGSITARSSTTFADNASAQLEILKIQQHLYRFFSREGFYLIENFLLFPPDTLGPGLTIPGWEGDPYSFQLTFVFPSGYERDFADSTSVPQPSEPARFRDAEFRRYAEKMIRKFCPAHILPRIRWIDSALSGSVIPADAPCFDLFEQRYRAWLSAYLTDPFGENVSEVLRADLVSILNNIYLQTFI